MAAICGELGLPNLCLEEVDARQIKEAIKYNHMKELKKEIKRFEKLDDISNDDFRNTQSYMKYHSLEFCRSLRTKQFRCRANMPKLFGDVLWCHSCSSSQHEGPGGAPTPSESQQHLQQCVAYSHLREGKDVELSFDDRVKYFMELSVERDKQKWYRVCSVEPGPSMDCTRHPPAGGCAALDMTGVESSFISIMLTRPE